MTDGREADRSRRGGWLVGAVVALAFVLRHDLWWAHDARLVLGLPVSLLYHVGWCLLASLLMAWLWRRGEPTTTEPGDGA